MSGSYLDTMKAFLSFCFIHSVKWNSVMRYFSYYIWTFYWSYS